MDKLLLVANWKSNKNTSEAISFLHGVGAEDLDSFNAQAIVCPSFLSVPDVAKFIRANDLPIEVGVQDVSPFEKGAYTGEVSSEQAKEFASYCIIGHSERRKNFLETDEMILEKAKLAKKNGLRVIVCVSNEKMPVPEEADIIAFEPIEAIGTGNPDSPEHIKEVFSHLSRVYPGKKLLYGGSVTPDNIQSFKSIENLSGFLVGGASLEADSYIALLKKC